jgi:hypothetical protein
MTTATATAAAAAEPQEQPQEQQAHDEGPADDASNPKKRARVDGGCAEEASTAAAPATATTDMKVLRDTLLDPEAVAALRNEVRQSVQSVSPSVGFGAIRRGLTDPRTSYPPLTQTPLEPLSAGQYPSAPGYPHCVAKDVLDPGFFRGLRAEMVGALSANFKETDLFKLFQTGDLANLDASDPEMVSQSVPW